MSKMNWTDTWAAVLWPVTVGNNILFQQDFAYFLPLAAAVYLSGLRTIPTALPPVKDLAKGYAAGAVATYGVRVLQKPGSTSQAVLASVHGS